MNPGLFSLDDHGAKILTAEKFQQFRKFQPFCTGLGGHRVKLYENYFPNETTFKFTFLRDPIQRYISHFNHQNNVMGYGWTMEEFAEQDEYKNFQIRRIANEENLEKAINILENNTDFVGITELFDESVLLMSYLIGDGFNPHYEKRNTAKERQDKVKKFEAYSTRMQEIIRENNALDIKLYDHVLHHIFSKWQEKYRDKLFQDITSFDSTNKKFKYSETSKFRIKINHYYSTAIQKWLL